MRSLHKTRILQLSMKHQQPALLLLSPSARSVSPGEDATRLKRFSVVVGSFQNPTNARSLKDRMEGQGYNAVLATNDAGMLRVIVASYDTRDEAVASRDAIRSRFAPDFKDAWLLENDL